MKSTEVLNEYPTDKHRRKIQNHLKSLGYKLLGSGVAAMVYGKDVGPVIKIIFPTDADGHTPTDPQTEGMLAFYKTCMEMKTPHVPKFAEIEGKHYTTFLIDGEEFLMIAIEKLDPIKARSFTESMVQIISSSVNFGEEWTDLKNGMRYSNRWADVNCKSPKKFADYAGKNISKIETEWMPFYYACKWLHETGEGMGYYWDLHQENVMQRKDGTVVITDPWVV